MATLDSSTKFVSAAKYYVDATSSQTIAASQFGNLTFATTNIIEQLVVDVSGSIPFVHGVLLNVPQFDVLGRIVAHDLLPDYQNGAYIDAYYAGDFDGDKLDDLLVAYGQYAKGGKRLELRRGASLTPVVTSLQADLTVLGIGDIDADGAADVIARINENRLVGTVGSLAPKKSCIRVFKYVGGKPSSTDPAQLNELDALQKGSKIIISQALDQIQVSERLIFFFCAVFFI